MSEIKFDFNNMLAYNIGRKDGVTESEISRFLTRVKRAHEHLQMLLRSPANRVKLGLEWVVLPFQEKQLVDELQRVGDEIAYRYDNVLFLGIGGSYLGLKAAQEALCSPYYNELKEVRNGRARVYFEGNNLDPTPLKVLLGVLDPKRTFVVVISKSGETTETKAAFEVVESWLKEGVGSYYGQQIFCITDPSKGSLRKRVDEEQSRDATHFRNASLSPGVGGRYSEFNMGLLHLSVAGINITEVLAGARKMAERCAESNLYKNPAYLYAALQYLAYVEKGKSVAIMMPFTELLKSTADWYSQLLAESLGKKYERKIKVGPDGLEEWGLDLDRRANCGRTPVAARGTTDLHSIQQNNVEGENNKTVTMIRVEHFSQDLRIPDSNGFLSNRSFSELLKLAQEATEWALVREKRPNATIQMHEVSPFTWGSLIYFFEMATAFEGELLNVNAFDQPGVEGYKNYMSYKLRKPGIPKTVASEIKKHPVKKLGKYILKHIL